MARTALLDVVSSGITPDRARAEYLARRLEEIRAVLAPADMDFDQLLAALEHVKRMLERIPRQT